MDNTLKIPRFLLNYQISPVSQTLLIILHVINLVLCYSAEFSGHSGKCSNMELALKRENSEGDISYSSNGSYTPRIKVESPAYPPPYSICQGQSQKVVTPIDCLPKGQPIPEAFRLQFLHDQKKQEDHVYQNVEKLSLQDGCVDIASDPKKLAQLGREESEESNYNNEENLEFTKSDPKKVKALEDFDKDIEYENQEMETFPASDPKKLAMLLDQDSIVSGSKSASEVEYENVPLKQTLTQVQADYKGGSHGSESESHGSEHESHTCDGNRQNYGNECQRNASDETCFPDYGTEIKQQVVVASHSQPIKACMLALFDNYQHDIGESYLPNGDTEEVFDFDLGVEGDDDSESTLTESTCNDEELFDSGPAYENYPPKKEVTTTTTETITAHHRKVEYYQNMLRAGGQSQATEQSDGTELDTKHCEDNLITDGFQNHSQASRAPTEDECYE